MRKLIIFILVLLGCFSTKAFPRTVAIKIGQMMTVYKITDYGESNYWGRNIAIVKEEIPLPDDAYYEDLKIPKKEWECFSASNNGIYDTQLELVQKEKDELQQNYNNLYTRNSQQEKNTVIIISILVIIFSIIVLFLIVKIRSKNKQLKIFELDQRVSNLS